MSDTYFVRTRGRISGPFDVASLQKLVRRGMLSRVHEVSPDRRSWTAAGDFEELFPVPSGSAATAVAGGPATVAVAAAAPSGFFYIHNGETVGPVPVAILQALARSGTLEADDVVWADGSDSSAVAARLPALAQIFASSGSRPIAYASRRTATGPASKADLALAGGILTNTRAICQITGIVAGAALILLLNLPIASVQDRVIWWWDALRQPRIGAVGILLFFVLFAGIVAAVVAAAVHGLVRGWIFVGLASLSFVLMLVVGLYQAGSGGGFFIYLIVPYLASALVGISYFKGRFPGARIGTIFQAIFGGTLVGATVIAGMVGMIEDSGLNGHGWGGEMPGWMVLGLTIGVLGTAAGIAAGVLGLVGLKPKYSPAVNWTAVGCAGASIVLPFFAIMIVAGGLASEFTDKSGIFIFTCFRVITVFGMFLALLAVGLAEIFVSSHVRAITNEQN